MNDRDTSIAADVLWRLLRRVVNVNRDEVAALCWSFAYFFCVLCAYYILRPVRDEMAIQQGVGRLQWGFTGTFVAMLCAVPVFGALVAWCPRRRLLPVVYGFFILNLLVFYVLFQPRWVSAHVAGAFFVWFNVFNLYIVSVFWSLMADVFNNEQARRLFGFIAAGGSTGAILGPALTGILTPHMGIVNLLLLAAGFLALAVLCIRQLVRGSVAELPVGDPTDVSVPLLADPTEPAPADDVPIGGGILAGVKLVLRSSYLLGICLYIWLYATLATFVYFEQVHIVSQALGTSEVRTTLFAYMDLAVNIMAFFGQMLITGRIIARWGLPVALAVVPVVLALGFVVLGLLPTLATLVVFQVVLRSGNYAIVRPTREVLFTVVAREEKYKAKNFIDTVVHRGGDMLSSWLFTGLSWLGVGLSGIAFAAVPVAALWMATGVLLGRKQEKLRRGADEDHP